MYYKARANKDSEILQVQTIDATVKIYAKALWPEAEVEIFGSRKTEVALAYSNLNLVVVLG